MNKLVLTILLLLAIGFKSSLALDPYQFNSNLHLGIENASGSLSNWHEPEEFMHSFIEFQGFRNQGNDSFSGSIKYSFGIEKNTIWPVHSEWLYPYWSYDDTEKTFYQNNVSLNGAYNRRIGLRLQAGLMADYKLVNAYNQSDPRYKTSGSTLNLKLPLSYLLKSLSFGLEPGIKKHSRSQDMIYINDNPGYVFQSLGLGVQSSPDRPETYDSRFDMLGYSIKFNTRYIFKNFTAQLIYDAYTLKGSYEWSDNNWAKLVPEAEMEILGSAIGIKLKHNSKIFKQSLNIDFKNHSKIGQEIIRKEEASPQFTGETVWNTYGKIDKYSANTKKLSLQYNLGYNMQHNTFGLIPALDLLWHQEDYPSFEQSYKYEKNLIGTGSDIYLNIQRSRHIYLCTGYKYLSPEKLYLNAAESNFKDLIYHKEVRYYQDGLNQLSFKGEFGSPLNIRKTPAFLRILLKVNYIYANNLSRTTSGLSFVLSF